MRDEGLDQDRVRLGHGRVERVQIIGRRDPDHAPDDQPGGPEPGGVLAPVGPVQLRPREARLAAELEDFVHRLVAVDAEDGHAAAGGA